MSSPSISESEKIHFKFRPQISMLGKPLNFQAWILHGSCKKVADKKLVMKLKHEIPMRDKLKTCDRKRIDSDEIWEEEEGEEDT